MPVSANKQANPIAETKVTSISTNARIDYIMRFSKHAVLVVDEDSDIYSAVGSLFLGALPSNHNAAFISLSPKLNEIQIRCRLIEQLFVDSLFDPEEALAVTVLKLSTDSKEVISIVIENVQCLSLQLMHEFCQLAELAANAGRSVNVLLLGEEKTRELISDNKVVFTNKLSIVSAADGQLISIDTLVSNKNHSKLLTPFRKGLIAIICLSSAAIVSIVLLYQTQSPSFSGQTPLLEQPSLSKDTEKVESTTFIKVKEEALPQAKGSEIYQQLMTDWNERQDNRQIEIAKPNDVANILISEQVKAEQLVVEKEQNIDTFASTIILDSTTNAEGYENNLGRGYFQKIKHGFVAQIIGFSKLETYKIFMEKYRPQKFASYTRILKNKKVFIITTQVYPLKSDVETVISMLPLELQKNKPWIKSIEAINSEISEYENSQ